MGSEEVRREQGAFHVPTVWCPGFSRFGPPEGGTPSQFRPTASFWVSMHAENRKSAFQEPEGRARQSPARRLCIAKLRRARSNAPYRFKVPMHVQKRKGASTKFTRQGVAQPDHPGRPREAPPAAPETSPGCGRIVHRPSEHPSMPRIRSLTSWLGNSAPWDGSCAIL